MITLFPFCGLNSLLSLHNMCLLVPMCRTANTIDGRQMLYLSDCLVLARGETSHIAGCLPFLLLVYTAIIIVYCSKQLSKKHKLVDSIPAT